MNGQYFACVSSQSDLSFDQRGWGGNGLTKLAATQNRERILFSI